ncbi:hypothetical protein PSQ90_13760 [Devosia rhodophyticola]|uniref:Uncharacterized protein n=1 Tax=Devosia rhodophyticola TaxID=3026423 RepID=A0ABY7YVK1_9HYPH|nr:hypothetical protein [Devosia rhodophyticola]WDR05339.1 hypothetical protein PSQ90_13760 [Devosia rhodophyticola]
MGNKNFLRRAVDALIESRTRQAKRYVERFEAEHDVHKRPEFTKF